MLIFQWYACLVWDCVCICTHTQYRHAYTRCLLISKSKIFSVPQRKWTNFHTTTIPLMASKNSTTTKICSILILLYVYVCVHCVPSTAHAWSHIVNVIVELYRAHCMILFVWWQRATSYIFFFSFIPLVHVLASSFDLCFAYSVSPFIQIQP